MRTPTQTLTEKLRELNTATIEWKELHKLCKEDHWKGFEVDHRCTIPFSPTLEEAIFNLALAGIIKYDWEYGIGTLIVVDKEKLK